MRRNASIILCIACVLFMLPGCDASSSTIGFDSPRGGELYVIGQSQQLRLALKVRAKSVLIELSEDGGVTYKTVGTIDNTVKDPLKHNVLSWTVTGPASTNCIFRATISSKQGSLTFNSGAFVIISQPSVLGAFAGLSGSNTFSGPQLIETGSDTNMGLIIKGNSSGQTADLQEWQNSDGKAIAALSPAGILTVASLSAVNSFVSGTEIIQTGSDAAQGLLIKANSPTQTGDLQQWLGSDGKVLASLSATGTLTAASLVSLAGFSGNGSALTNLNAGALTGTLPDARLSANVALLNRDPQTFSGVTTFNAPGTALNVANTAAIGNLIVGGGQPIKKHLSVTAALVFPAFSLLGLGVSDQTVNVPGAALGDTVTVGVPANPASNIIMCAYVSAANTVTIRWANILLPPAGNPPSGTYRVDVWQH